MLAVVLCSAAAAGPAAAAPVLVLGRHGGVSVRNDPFLSGPALTPAPIAGAAPTPGGPAPAAREAAAARVAATASAARASGPRGRRRRPQPTVVNQLGRLYRSHAITPAAYQQYLTSFRRALAAERHLTGVRLSELAAVTRTLHEIAVAGALTPSRLPALFATLDRNRQWWTSGPLLPGGQRVEFAGSQLVWEYYPGQGIQLQALGSFGKADGLYTAGPANYPAMERLLSELIPLGAERGGGLAWEYYFHFDGGSPPWTSAMSQATGLEALTRAYQATRNPYYLDVASQALAVFTVAPPVGVAVPTPSGTRFLQYSFAPGASIINAFLQTLIGLYDYAHVSSNPLAGQLLQAGNAEAMVEVPQFDTGAWSLYQPGIEDDLSYHELVTGFLQELCTRIKTPAYCLTAQHFQSYLKTPPVLTQLTFDARRGRATALRFRVSKYSHVGIVVTRDTRTVLATSASFPYGTGAFTVPALKRPGAYEIRLAATDLAGNFSRITGTLQVSR